MGELLVKDKDIVVPGEELAKGIDFLPAEGAFREKESIIASQVGLVSVNARLIKVIPLSGKYVAKRGDIVIGKIVDMSFNNWFVDIGCANEAALSVRDTSEYIDRGADLSRYYNFGDVIVAGVNKVTRSNIDLTMKGPGFKKVTSGKLIKVIPSKVPRIIGKLGSMVGMVKEQTNCRITVGQNGVVWLQGEPENELLATRAIKMIDENAHKEGLTDEVKSFLEKEGKNLPKNLFEKKLHQKESVHGKENNLFEKSVHGKEPFLEKASPKKFANEIEEVKGERE